MDINRILAGEPIVFEGFLHKREKGHLSIQLHPGLTVDVAEKSCSAVEEATDPVTGKTFIRFTLDPNADINATFQPRLARLALTQDQAGVPFSMGGLPEGVEEGPIFLAQAGPAGGGPSGPGGGTFRPYITPTAGEFHTRSRRGVWGWHDTVSRWSPCLKNCSCRVNPGMVSEGVGILFARRLA